MIGLIGINYKSAPIEIREKFSFSDDDILKFNKLLRIDKSLKGLVVLSTCNRTEIYFNITKCCETKGVNFIFRNLEFFKDYTDDLRKYFYVEEGQEAIAHLFKVVSGLDSLVIGEDQIIGQTKNAFRLSLDNNMAGSILTRMFNKAFEAGKRVRTETTINQGAGSVSSAAVCLCQTKYNDITSKNILLVGAGQTGELSLMNFAKRNCRTIKVTNRTFSKAQDIANKHHGEAFELQDLEKHLPEADIIIVATGATTHLITPEMVAKAVKDSNKEQLYIDLSVPRNISDKIVETPNIELYTVDDLQAIVKETSMKRQESTTEALEIINTVQEELSDWLHIQELTPTILKIKQSFSNVNSSELKGFIKIKSPDNAEEVEDYAQHITEKYARLFIRNLKNVTNNGKNKEYVKLVNDLFELS